MLDNCHKGSLRFPASLLDLARRCLLACSSRGEGGMTKAEPVAYVAVTVSVPKHQTAAVITWFLEAIMEALYTGKRVELQSFGCFRLRHLQARVGRHPRTEDTVQIPAKQVLVFTVERAFQGLEQI